MYDADMDDEREAAAERSRLGRALARLRWRGKTAEQRQAAARHAATARWQQQRRRRRQQPA
jgi:hypothetical protein